MEKLKAHHNSQQVAAIISALDLPPVQCTLLATRSKEPKLTTLQLTMNVGSMKSPIKTPLHERELRDVAANANGGSTPPPFSDLYIVSPPPQSNHKSTSKKRTPRPRASLTPPPCSEQINRAVRSAECQLDAAVDDVQRYISQGCPDSDSKDRLCVRVGSPESDYSDDLLSPRNLPDFDSPLNGECLSFQSIKSDGYGREDVPRNCSNQENEEPNAHKIRTRPDNLHQKNQVKQHPCANSSPTKEDEISEFTNEQATRGRTLRFNGSRFEVLPPLNCSES